MEDTEIRGESVDIVIDWQEPASLATIYANQMSVTRAAGEFFIRFYELRAPVLVEKEQIKKFKAEKKLAAVCVARLVVPSGSIEAMIRALQDVVAKTADVQYK
ncbi:MAG: hypothetical protein HY650_07375 [Acidobacteria bacterium]|nr:hypothetical protein [Acidobacteriota bacterium]